MDIINELMSQIGSKGIASIASQIGADDNQTSNALGGIVPTLLGAMAKNSSTQSGANGLLSALDSDHDGSILDDVAGFASNFTNGPGEGILRHVLGGNQPTVERGLSAKTGLNSNQISSLLKIAAPLVLGYLGRQKRQSSSSGFDANGLAGLLGGMTKTADKSTGIDLGDILSIVGGLSGGGNTRSRGLGGLLGRLLRR